jgi:hypothetical protein
MELDTPSYPARPPQSLPCSSLDHRELYGSGPRNKEEKEDDQLGLVARKIIEQDRLA